MKKYEYLYFVDMPPSRGCTGLYGDRVESLFPKHQKVLMGLLGSDPAAVEKLAHLLARRGMDAVKVRFEFGSPEGADAEPSRPAADFERLLHGALLDLIECQPPRGRAVERDCTVLVEPVKTKGNQRPGPGWLLDGATRGSTELTPAAEMGDPPPAMARTQHQRRDEDRLDRLRVPKREKEAPLSPAQEAIETQPKLSAEKSLRQFAVVLADLERLVDRPPATLKEALKELRIVAKGLAAVVGPWVSRILGHYRGSRYETLQEKRAVGSDITAAVKGFGLAVFDGVSGVAGSLYARHDRSEPGGKFCIEYVKDGKSNSRVLGENLPEIVLAPADTSPRKSRVLPGSVAHSKGPE